MDPDKPDIRISDVVVSIAGRDAGNYYYVTAVEEDYVLVCDGRGRTLDKPKRKKRKHIEKVLRSETRVAGKLLSGDKVLNGELRRDLASLCRGMQAENRGG